MGKARWLTEHELKKELPHWWEAFFKGSGYNHFYQMGLRLKKKANQKLDK